MTLVASFVEAPEPPPKIGEAHSAQGRVAFNLSKISDGIVETLEKSISFNLSFQFLYNVFDRCGIKI